MKQFIFSFKGLESEWVEVVEADGMYSALKMVQQLKRDTELSMNEAIQIELKRIHYRHVA